MADLRGRVTFAQKECLCHLHTPCMVSWSIAECCYLNIYKTPFFFLFRANYLLKWYGSELIKMVPLILFWSWQMGSCSWNRNWKQGCGTGVPGRGLYHIKLDCPHLQSQAFCKPTVMYHHYNIVLFLSM
jgi:hypothetical protein